MRDPKLKYKGGDIHVFVFNHWYPNVFNPFYWKTRAIHVICAKKYSSRRWTKKNYQTTSTKILEWMSIKKIILIDDDKKKSWSTLVKKLLTIFLLVS